MSLFAVASVMYWVAFLSKSGLFDGLNNYSHNMVCHYSSVSGSSSDRGVWQSQWWQWCTVDSGRGLTIKYHVVNFHTFELNPKNHEKSLRHARKSKSLEVQMTELIFQFDQTDIGLEYFQTSHALLVKKSSRIVHLLSWRFKLLVNDI
jgi:hypothetical protein